MPVFCPSTTAQTQELRFLVISDLHCHEIDRLPQESYLLAGQGRTPSSMHPVQALIELAGHEGLTADALLLAGDLTNRISQVGLDHGWGLVQEIARRFEATAIVATWGNHDVDSRKSHGSDPFKLPRNLHPSYPVESDAERTRYLAHGVGITTIRGVDIVSLNSAIDHTDETQAKRGQYGPDRIDELGRILSRHHTGNAKVAILHHHPILHSSPFSKTPMFWRPVTACSRCSQPPAAN